MTVVACLGDSITEGSPHWDARRRVGDPIGQWQHWASRLHPGLELRNHGVWGERTDEILARFDEAVARADALVLQGGINDLAQGRSVEEAAAGFAALVARGRTLGVPLAVCDVLPWDGGWPEQEPRIRALNAAIAAHGLPLLPFHDALEDPDRPGRMKPEWAHHDGDHPSVAGYRRLGEVAFRWPF